MLGNGGKLKIGGVDIDIEEWSIEGDIPNIENTLGGAATSTHEEGRPVVTFMADVRLNGNAEAQLINRFTGATPTSGAVAAIFYLSGTKTLAGNVIFSKIGTGVKPMVNEIVKVPIAGKFTGAITFTA